MKDGLHPRLDRFRRRKQCVSQGMNRVGYSGQVVGKSAVGLEATEPATRKVATDGVMGPTAARRGSVKGHGTKHSERGVTERDPDGPFVPKGTLRNYTVSSIGERYRYPWVVRGGCGGAEQQHAFTTSHTIPAIPNDRMTASIPRLIFSISVHISFKKIYIPAFRMTRNMAMMFWMLCSLAFFIFFAVYRSHPGRARVHGFRTMTLYTNPCSSASSVV